MKKRTPPTPREKKIKLFKVTPGNSVEDLEMLQDSYDDKIVSTEELIDMLL